LGICCIFRYIIFEIPNTSNDTNPYLKFFKKYISTSTTGRFLGVPLFENKYIGYSDIEIQKLKRTYDWMISVNHDEKLLKNQYNFKKFVEEHDEKTRN
jgi:hypothetical protein